MKKILMCVITIMVSLLMVGCDNNDTDTVKKIGTYEVITSQAVKEVLDNKDENYILIDVREVYEYNEGHIMGSVNIPLGIINTVNYSKDKTLIVYCKSGNRSYEAGMQLKNMGYTVKDMGSIGNWTYELEY